MKGRVIKSTGSWYTIQLDDGSIVQGRVRGKIRLEGIETTNPIAVGDVVHLKLIEDGTYQILEIEPRNNYIIRKSVKKKNQSHIIAANMDQAAIVVTMAYPKTSTGFIDRFLVTSEAYSIPQLIIFNKSDLLNSKQDKKARELRDYYSSIGIECFFTSAVKETGIDELTEALGNKTTLFSGHSGVGKSSLLNLIIPEAEQEVKEISSWTEKGLHTTTFAEMFFLDNTSFIIDTPGIKELGLVEMDPEEISDYFPDIREHQSGCKFNNCLHVHEPGCAVKKALEKNEIALFRYDNYLSMLSNEDNFR